MPDFYFLNQVVLFPGPCFKCISSTRLFYLSGQVILISGQGCLTSSLDHIVLHARLQDAKVLRERVLPPPFLCTWDGAAHPAGPIGPPDRKCRTSPRTWASHLLDREVSVHMSTSHSMMKNNSVLKLHAVFHSILTRLQLQLVNMLGYKKFNLQLNTALPMCEPNLLLTTRDKGIF